MQRSSRLLLLSIILLAAGLRFPGLFNNHFHADEALFASWARLIAIWRDPLLLAQPVDKPPLLFYLQALAYPLFGPVEWAARLPSLAASILSVPLTAVFARRAYRQDAVAAAAALIVAMSPLAVQFSATAFTDPLLVALLLAALLWICEPTRPGWAGAFFGLALLTKYQALMFLPLLIALAWLAGWKPRQWRRSFAGFLPLLLLFLLWSFIDRGQSMLWVTQTTNFGGLRLSWSWELFPRLDQWASLSHQSLGSALMAVLFVTAVLILIVHAHRSATRRSAVDAVLLLFIFAYLALHWLAAVPIWDRYLLPLVPLAALVIGRALALTARRAGSAALSKRWAAAALLLLVLVQLPAAISARSGIYPFGGRSDADQGAWQVAAYLRDAPYGTVLYDHWYSWHWRYAFIDKGVYTSWYAHPQALAEDLHVFGGRQASRYLVLPADARALPVFRVVTAEGFSLTPVLQTAAHPGMILYLLEPAGP